MAWKLWIGSPGDFLEVKTYKPETLYGLTQPRPETSEDWPSGQIVSEWFIPELPQPE